MVHGCVDPPSALYGRRRILTGEVIDELRELLQESPELYLDEIVEWLALYYYIHISIHQENIQKS